MKVIFLDNDGVICLADNWGSRRKKYEKHIRKGGKHFEYDTRPVEFRFDNFDKKAITVLNEIIEETGAEIVVSSDWRYHANLEELGDYYQAQGIIKRPIAMTPKSHEITDERWLNELGKYYKALEAERAIEIKYWLSLNPQVTHWVAVDDLFMGKEIKSRGYVIAYEYGLDNFVYTPKSREGIKQSGIKEKIIKWLK